MNARLKLFFVVALLVLAGGSVACYKYLALGVPFWAGESRSEWLIEAKVSFNAQEGRPVKAILAVPEVAFSEGASQEAGSLGYGFHIEPSDGGEMHAVWTARNRKGEQALYFRLRVRDSHRVGGAWSTAGSALPVVEAPGLPGSLRGTAGAMVARARESSADNDSLFVQLFQQLKDERSSQNAVLLRRHYEEEGGEAADVLLGIDLLRLAGVPARPAFGLRLDEELGAQEPVRLVEYFNGFFWKVRDPDAPAEPLRLTNLFVWHRGSGPMLEVFGGERSKLWFTAVRNRIPLDRMADLRKSPFLVATIHGLPASERNVFRYVVLIPLGAFVVVVMRNLIGIPTLGTFMPVLLALALLEMPLVSGLAMFALIVVAGTWFRFLLSRLNLLVVPRVAACVVIVVLLMMLMSVASYKLGISTGLKITLFPMIILAWTLERMSLIWEEEGARDALLQVGGSVVVSVAAYGFMRIQQVQYWAFYFPELLLVLLAAILLMGRYTGYRLLELFRFREFTEP
jgi:hypothetical protein